MKAKVENPRQARSMHSDIMSMAKVKQDSCILSMLLS